MNVRRIMSLLVLAVIGTVPLTSNGVADARSHAGRPAPLLRLVPAQGYQLAVAGKNWNPRSRVTLALAQGDRVAGLEVRASGDGTFEVGVKHIDLCGGEAITVRDFFDHEVTVHGPRLMCPTRSNPPVPVLTILRGSTPDMAVVPLMGKTTHTTTTIKQGDVVYFWSPGSKHPAMTPRAPHYYFSLITRGQRPSPACTTVKCRPGFIWEWVGMKAGDTGVTLGPWCVPLSGHACPQVLVFIPVLITSRLEP